MRRVFIYIFWGFAFCSNALPAFSQHETDNWLFGTRNQFNFSSGSPVLTVNSPLPFDAQNGITVLSSSAGKLLLYDDNYKTYNQNGTVVYNHPYNTYPQEGQGIVGFLKPGQDSLYYIFGISNYNTPYIDIYPKYRSAGYWVINMNMNGGLGGLYKPQEQLTPYNDSVCTKLTAVLHCNKKDVWVVGHYKNSDKYYAFLVTDSGVSSTPVISTCNLYNDKAVHPLSWRFNHQGNIKFSPDGKKLAAAFTGDSNYVELSDFNAQTGQITNPKKVKFREPYHNIFPTMDYHGTGCYGVEFSPSGKFLYATSYYFYKDSGDAFFGYVYQFDVTSNNEAAIQQSRVKIDSVFKGILRGLQLASNGKIYSANGRSDGYGIIPHPEVAGLGCGYTLNDYNSSLIYVGSVFPSFLQSYFRFPVIATGNCQFQNIVFSLGNMNDVTNINWDFGDPASGVANNQSTQISPTHIFSRPGLFNVKAVVYTLNACAPDTVYKTIYAGPFKVFLGNDTSICKGDTLVLHVNIPNANNRWSNGSTDTLMKVWQTGRYGISVNIGECVATDSIDVTVNNLPAFTLGRDTAICINQQIILQPTPNYPNIQYQWSNGSMQPSISTSNAGSYWLQLKDSIGCAFADTIQLQTKALPGFNLGRDTAYCQGQQVVLKATVPHASFLWNTGATASQITVNQSAIYYCDATTNGCTYRDSIDVLFKPTPFVSLGKDTTVCENAGYTLDAGNTGASYLWQDGTTTNLHQVNAKGLYWVKVTQNGCSSTDSVAIDFDYTPKFTLGLDQVICPNETKLLQPNVQFGVNAQYRWGDGSDKPYFSITQPGSYTVSVSNFCGTQAETINFSQGVCKLILPNAFSPNGDGINDVFKPSYGENVVTYKMQIFDRYGRLVFESSSKELGWNGKINGANASVGVYYWTISFTSSTVTGLDYLKGSVMLLR